jgi:hypothetical protein
MGSLPVSLYNNNCLTYNCNLLSLYYFSKSELIGVCRRYKQFLHFRRISKENFKFNKSKVSREFRNRQLSYL